MTTNTYTCSVFKGNVPKVVYKGDQSVSGYLAWTAASNPADVGFLCKIPHGATIVDFYEYHSTGATTCNMSFGFGSGVAAGGGAGLSVLIQGGNQATMNRFNVSNWKGASTPGGNVFPPTISVSDTDTQRYAILEALIAAGMTATTSTKVWFTIIYRMDGPQPRPPGAQADVP
jgi:hypothetical protein